MKQFANLILVLFLVSCSKENAEVVKPAPSEEPPKSAIQLSVQIDTPVDADSIEANYKLSGVHTDETIRVVKLGKVSGSEGLWKSALINLAPGSYMLQQLLIKHGGEAIAVTPIQGSKKAQQFSKALPYQLFLNQNQVQAVTLQAKPIGDTDGPAAFGYPSTSFPQQGLLVKPVATIQVGAKTYQLPVPAIEVETIYENGESNTATVELQGDAGYYVSAKARSYRFKTTQWNLSLTREITKAALTENPEVLFEGSKTPAILLRDETFLEVQGAWMPKDKTLYDYRADGKLQQITHFQKKPQVFELVQQFVDKAVYAGARLQEVVRFDGYNKQVGSTQYEYAGNAVSHIIQTMYGMTTSSVLEPALPDGTASDVYIILSNSATLHYSASFVDGNKVSYRATSSTSMSEGGEFQYDSNINPYSFFMFPDMYLTNVSKNNVVGRGQGYSGGFPVSVPYKYEYQYNADGYPTELITYYKGYINDEPLYRTKKVFYYQ